MCVYVFVCIKYIISIKYIYTNIYLTIYISLYLSIYLWPDTRASACWHARCGWRRTRPRCCYRRAVPSLSTPHLSLSLSLSPALPTSLPPSHCLCIPPSLPSSLPPSLPFFLPLSVFHRVCFFICSDISGTFVSKRPPACGPSTASLLLNIITQALHYSGSLILILLLVP